MFITEYDEAATMDKFRKEGINIGVKQGIDIGVKQGIDIGVKKGATLHFCLCQLRKDRVENCVSAGAPLEGLCRVAERGRSLHAHRVSARSRFRVVGRDSAYVSADPSGRKIFQLHTNQS